MRKTFTLSETSPSKEHLLRLIQELWGLRNVMSTFPFPCDLRSNSTIHRTQELERILAHQIPKKLRISPTSHSSSRANIWPGSPILSIPYGISASRKSSAVLSTATGLSEAAGSLVAFHENRCRGNHTGMCTHGQTKCCMSLLTVSTENKLWVKQKMHRKKRSAHRDRTLGWLLPILSSLENLIAIK
jgi:hypothetical protein